MLVTFGLPILVRFPSNPWFIRQYPWFLLQIFPPSDAIGCLRSWPWIAPAVRKWGGVRRVHMGGKKLFADSSAKLFWRTIYCANPRPNARYQSRSRSCRGLGSWAPRGMHEYDLTTAITICMLNKPHTCKMVSSIFSAMSQLKFAGTIRASLPSILST